MPLPDVPNWLPSKAQMRERAQRAAASLTGTTVTPDKDAAGKDKPLPITPHMEGRGNNNPYRGQQMHGVAPGAEWEPVTEFGNGTIDVVWDHNDPDEHVVPVRIVADADEQIKTWRTGQSQAPGTGNSPAPILPRNRQRTKATIKNTTSTGQTLWIGRDVNVNPFSGYPLAAAEVLAFEHTETVYAISSDANPCPVSFAYEFVERVTVK